MMAANRTDALNLILGALSIAAVPLLLIPDAQCLGTSVLPDDDVASSGRSYGVTRASRAVDSSASLSEEKRRITSSS
jgi:hypothetical protein